MPQPPKKKIKQLEDSVSKYRDSTYAANKRGDKKAEAKFLDKARKFAGQIEVETFKPKPTAKKTPTKKRNK